jgi:lipoate-protein ligase A
MLDRLAHVLTHGLIHNVLPFDFDNDLLKSMKSLNLPKFVVYPFSFKAIVAGRGSDIAREVRLPLCVEDNIPVYRRPGGGCSVFLDTGNLIVSIAFPAPGFSGITSLFNQCNDWLIKGFNSLGLKGLYTDGISDLVIGDRKLGGSCFYRTKGFGYYSAAILVSPNLELMEKYLYHPPREPVYRKNRSHKNFVIGLDAIISGVTITRLSDELKKNLNLNLFKS